MEGVFLALLHVSVNAGWLVLAVLLLRAVFRKAPGWLRCAFWGMVAYCLLCPVSAASPWSLRPDTGRIFERCIQLDQVRSSVMLEGGRTGVGGLSIWSVPAVVWLVGMGAMLLFIFVSFRRLGRRLATAEFVLEADASRALTGGCDSNNVRSRYDFGKTARGFRPHIFGKRVSGNDERRKRQTAPARRIVQSRHIDSPFVFGVFRPLICLPGRMAEQDRRCAIAHEQAHIDRRDHWWKLIGFVLLSVYWFQPLLWAAYALFCRDIETACDEKVLRNATLEERRAYAAALLRCSVGRREPAAFPAFGESGVKGRIRYVMDYRKASCRMVAAAAAAGVITALVLLTDPVRSAGQSAAEAKVTAENIWQVVDSLDESGQREPVYLYVVCETGDWRFLVSRSICDFWDREVLLNNGDSRYVLAVPYDGGLYYVGEVA